MERDRYTATLTALSILAVLLLIQVVRQRREISSQEEAIRRFLLSGRKNMDYKQLTEHGKSMSKEFPSENVSDT